MELHDENTFKVRGYQNAVFNLDKSTVELGSLPLDGLEALDGIGKSIAATIHEINQTGTCGSLQNLLSETPEGIVELLDIKGIGPKKIRVLWKDLGIESGYELKEAATAGKVAKLKGFGKKTQETILKALEFKEANANKLHYAEAEQLSKVLIAHLEEILPKHTVTVVGALRRKLEVVEKLEILIATDNIDQAEAVINKSGVLAQDAKNSGPLTWRGIYQTSKIPIEISFCQEGQFLKKRFLKSAALLHLSTPVKEHENLKSLVQDGSFQTEKEIYLSAGMDYIEPELREGTFELEAAKNHRLPKLVEMADLKGILHNHSTYSDGKHSLEQMASHCKELGYEYLGISDHSKSAFYANGLDEDMIRRQHEEIDALNEKFAPFKIFKGIESDILYDGQLDYDDEVLATFDFIVASVHSILNMTLEKATSRLLTAIENPYTTILGHPTGRLLLRREGYPIDHRAIIDHCAKYGVVIEINANPWRLDLDWRWVHEALEKGVKLSINPDAHAMEGYQHMYYGLLAGRKGGLTKEMTFNALGSEVITSYFRERKGKIAAHA